VVTPPEKKAGCEPERTDPAFLSPPASLSVAFFFIKKVLPSSFFSFFFFRCVVHGGARIGGRGGRSPPLESFHFSHDDECIGGRGGRSPPIRGAKPRICICIYSLFLNCFSFVFELVFKFFFQKS